MYLKYPSFQQLWTVALCLTHPMAKLVTLLEQHLDRQPSTVVTQATTWWETVLAHVKPQESGLGMHLPVNVCCMHIKLFEVTDQGSTSELNVHSFCSTIRESVDFLSKNGTDMCDM